MSDELKPCPFCGQQEAFVEQLDSDASVVICQGMVDEHSACLARGPVGVQQSEMEDQPGRDAAIAEWNRRAQPAEAEGVELVPFWVLFDATTPEPLIKKHMPEGVLAFFDNEEDARRAKALHPGTDYKRAPYVRAAALSAVTSERDRMQGEAELSHSVADLLRVERDQLRAEVEALRVALHGIASVNPAERGIEWAKLYASDGLKGAGSELYARWLETFKEADALRALLNKALPVVEAHAGASHMLDGFRPARNKWDELVDGIRAAMAAKDRP